MVKYITLASAIFAGLLLGPAAMAACPVTNTFTNGTTANATQVNQNFSDLTGCVAPLASPSFTGNVTVNGATVGAGGQALTVNGSSGIGLSILTAPGQEGELYFDKGGAHSISNPLFYFASQVSNHAFTLVDYDGTNYVQWITADPYTNSLTLNGGIMPFQVSGAEAGRFGSDGSFLVGTMSNGGWFGNAKSEIRGGGNILSVYATGATGTGIITRVDNTATKLVDFNYAGSDVGTITTNGTTTAYNTTSDSRLKNIGVPQRDYSKAIKTLWVGDFRWKKGNEPGFGVIAQDAYAHFPEAVTKPASASGIWMVDYSKLAPLALWGVKDLYKETGRQAQSLAEARRQVNALTTQVAELRNVNDREAAEINRLRTQQDADIGALRTQINDIARKGRIQTAQK